MILLTNKDYSSMYNASLVVAEQLKAVGINAELLVMDWPASVQKQQNSNDGWNFFFTGYGTNSSLGGIAALLAMLNSCGSGVTVVNIDNGFGGGYAASQINALAAAR